MHFNKLTLLAFVVAASLPAAQAMAQDDGALLREGLFARDRNVSVEQRPRPEYAPIALRAGSFYVLPSITGTIDGNDNIYATSSNETSDTIFRVNPAIAAKSNWNRHALSMFANLNSSFYSDHDQENTTDYLLGFDGRLDVRHDLGLAGGASYERDTEPRSQTATQTVVNGLIAKPIRYDVGRAYVEGTYATNRYRFSGRVSVDDYTYDNAHTTGGAIVYQRDRDHTIVSEGARVEYALVPDTSFFALVTLNQRSFHNPALGEVLRDSTGYNLQVGANFDLTHLIRGEVAIGYLNQDYDSSVFHKSSGLSFNGKVQWFPTQLTTVTFTGSRSADDAGIPGVGGYTSTNIGAQIDHELLRNVILNAGAAYGYDDYNGYDRSDKRTNVYAGAKYLVNRAVTLNLTFNHYNQDSSGLHKAASYDVNRLYGSLSYAF
jgi:hypothetical protein